MHHINKIVYINLDKRADRRSAMEQEFVRIGIRGQRFAALTYNRCPNTGCLLSHATVLEQAYDEGCENVLVLEDDFKFIDDVVKVHTQMDKFFKCGLAWDVVMLTTCAAIISERTNDIVSKVVSSGNGAGYLVNRSMMLELSTLFKANVENLYQTKRHWEYQNDVLWKQLMPVSNWYMFNEYLGYQREGYSDLSEDYKIAIIPHTQVQKNDDYIDDIETEMAICKSLISNEPEVEIAKTLPADDDGRIKPYNVEVAPNIDEIQKVENEVNIVSQVGKGRPIWFDHYRKETTKGTTKGTTEGTTEVLTKDSIVNKVIASFVERSNVGLNKYGTTLDREDLSVLDWIQHAQEEHMDAILYLEKLKTYYTEK